MTRTIFAVYTGEPTDAVSILTLDGSRVVITGPLADALRAADEAERIKALKAKHAPKIIKRGHYRQGR